MLKLFRRVKMQDLISLATLGYVAIGALIGFISGFFGIGGGGILVPVMMYLGYDVKHAIGVSVVQMIFSSIFGSFVNFKSKILDVTPALVLGFGGFCGALCSGFIVSYFSSKFLLGVLVATQIFNLTRLFKTPSEPVGAANESKAPLFFIGLIVGAVAISVGIGGSVLVMPILVSFLNYDIKKAVGTGLFFVAFSSTAGFISLAVHGFVHYGTGVALGLGSLAGVYAGVKTSHSIGKKAQKRWMIALIVAILCVTIKKFIALN